MMIMLFRRTEALGSQPRAAERDERDSENRNRLWSRAREVKKDATLGKLELGEL